MRFMSWGAASRARPGSSIIVVVRTKMSSTSWWNAAVLAVVETLHAWHTLAVFTACPRASESRNNGTDPVVTARERLRHAVRVLRDHMRTMPRGSVPPQRDQQQAEFEHNMSNVVQTLGKSDDLQTLSNGLVNVMVQCRELARYTADTHIAAGVRASAGLFDVAASSLDQLHTALKASSSEEVNLRSLGTQKLRDRYNVCNALCAKLRLESLDLQSQTVEVIRRSAAQMQCRALDDIADALQSSATAVLDVDQDELSLTGCFTRLALQSQQVQAALATTNDIRVQALKTGDASAACRRAGSSAHERKVRSQQVQQSGVQLSKRPATSTYAVDQLTMLLEQAAANLRTFEKTLLQAAKQCDDYNHAAQNVKMCVGECTNEYNCAAAKKQLKMFDRVVHNVVTQFNADGESLASAVAAQIQLNTQAAWQHVSEIRRLVAGGAIGGGALSLVKQAKDFEEQYTNDEEQRLILLIRGHILPLVNALDSMTSPMLHADCAPSVDTTEEMLVLEKVAARQDKEDSGRNGPKHSRRSRRRHSHENASHKDPERRSHRGRRSHSAGRRRSHSTRRSHDNRRSGDKRSHDNRRSHDSRRSHDNRRSHDSRRSHAKRSHSNSGNRSAHIVREQHSNSDHDETDSVTKTSRDHLDNPLETYPTHSHSASKELSGTHTPEENFEKQPTDHHSRASHSSTSTTHTSTHDEPHDNPSNWSPGDDVVYHKQPLESDDPGQIQGENSQDHLTPVNYSGKSSDRESSNREPSEHTSEEHSSATGSMRESEDGDRDTTSYMQETKTPKHDGTGTAPHELPAAAQVKRFPMIDK